MYFPDSLNGGVVSAEVQLAMLKAALKALSLAALTTITATLLAYLLLCLAETKRP